MVSAFSAQSLASSHVQWLTFQFLTLAEGEQGDCPIQPCTNILTSAVDARCMHASWLTQLEACVGNSVR